MLFVHLQWSNLNGTTREHDDHHRELQRPGLATELTLLEARSTAGDERVA
jgi:hypothetical protein